MSDIAIKVENLSKRYRIGLKETQSETLAGTLTGWLKSPFQNYRSLRRLSQFSENGHDSDDVLWALKDVSFEVKHGEVVGIIGRNGAGKSTLLKILSRITEATSGRAVINGRIASLLEVGTGFNPELTGRENVYLNGTVLGMRKKEIDNKFDEIVDFSGIEKFIDTPVKHYSSGMKVRLAFAVAAHLEPEILLIDEVLAVGDAEFQKKCLGKMEKVASQGRTILFVSHSMAAVENLCHQVIVLQKGCIDYIGEQTNAIAFYLGGFKDEKSFGDNKNRIGTGAIQIVAIQIQNISGEMVEVVQSGQTIDICLRYKINSAYKSGRVNVGLTVSTQTGIKVFSQSTRIHQSQFDCLPPIGIFKCRIPRLPLPASRYYLGFNLKVDEEYSDAISEAIELNVVEGDFFNSGRVLPASLGVCLVDGEWSIERDNCYVKN